MVKTVTKADNFNAF